MESEPLFGDKPKKRQTVTIPPLTEDVSNEPKYEATDDDLPLIFWPEPAFDEEM